MSTADTWPALSPTDQRRLTTWLTLYRLQQCDGFTRQEALRLVFLRTLADAGIYAPSQAAPDAPGEVER